MAAEKGPKTARPKLTSKPASSTDTAVSAPPAPPSSNILTDPSSHPAHVLLSLAHGPETASALFTEKVVQRPLLYTSSTIARSGDSTSTLSSVPTSLSTPTPTPTPNPTSSASTDGRTRRRNARAARAARIRNKDRETARAYRAAGRPRPLSAKEKRALGVHAITKEGRQWGIYVPLWRMWVQYVRDVLGIECDDGKAEGGEPGGGNGSGGETGARPKNQYLVPAVAGPLIASLDFHGALVEVTRSRCLSRVGVVGIVLRDTKFTFELVTPESEVKVIPKEKTFFRIRIPLAKDPDIRPRPSSPPSSPPPSSSCPLPDAASLHSSTPPASQGGPPSDHRKCAKPPQPSNALHPLNILHSSNATDSSLPSAESGAAGAATAPATTTPTDAATETGAEKGTGADTAADAAADAAAAATPLPGHWLIPGKCLSFDIDGSRFANRAPDRAVKKTKDVFGRNAGAGGG